MNAAGIAAPVRRIAGREHWRPGVDRLRHSWWSVGQSALGGALAWEGAVHLLGHPAPFFAAVAAIVSLSTTYQNRLRRVGELALGVSVGVGIGDLLVSLIGQGGWQLGLVVVIAMSVGLFLDGGGLIVNQAALQAVFVTVLPPPAGGYLGRWLDALFGGLVALVIAFGLPPDPRPALRRDVGELVGQLSLALREVAEAARADDAAAALAALERARATQPVLDRWRGAIAGGEEVTRLSPLRRDARAEVAAHRRALAPMDRAVRNLRVAIRRVLAAVTAETRAGDPGGPTGPTDSTGSTPVRGGGRSGVPVPGPVLDRLEELARLLHTLPPALRDPDGEAGRSAREALTGYGEDLDLRALAPRSLSATVVVAQLRSAVIDLLQIPGVSEAQARAGLPR